jgi:transcriptional regulator with XRE-family HTH domain
MPNFSTRLRELRTKANISQQELAKIIGTSKSSINMYERGEREPGLETVGALADYFDVRTDYLLGKTDDKRSPRNAKKYNKLILQALENHRKLYGYDRKQLEELLDWEDMYSDLENGRTLGDEGLLKTIQGMLRFDVSLMSDPLLNKTNSPPEPQLTEGEKMLIDLFRQIPEEQQQVFLEMGRVYANSLKRD